MKLAVVQLVLALLVAPRPASGQSALEATGSGTVETNCLATLAPRCTVTSTGPMTGSPVLPGAFALRFDTGSPSSLNGYPGGAGDTFNHGVCLPASYRGALSETGGDSLEFTHAGLVCEEAAPGSPYVYTGTFRLTGGTGRFAAATGGGTLSATFTRDGAAAFVTLRGAISY